MKHKPVNKDYAEIELVRRTYLSVIKDNVITETEWRYLRALHHYIFKVVEESDEIILEDLKELSNWKSKLV